MSYLAGLPADAGLLAVFKAFPGPAGKLIEYHEVLLRGPSPFAVAERELIAAFVSALNGCRYCRGVHTATAEALGFAEGTVEALLENLESAPVEARLKPVLAYVRALTERPAGVSAADADAVRAAGWDDRAIHDLVSVTALFNFMNRFVEGLGVSADGDYYRAAAKRIAAGGYAALLPMIDAARQEDAP